MFAQIGRSLHTLQHCHTRAVRATAACPNQISNRAPEIGNAANQNCANCVFVCKKKKWQKRGKVAGKMKGKLDTAFEGEPFTHFLGYTFCETGRSERTQYWLNIFGFEEQRVQLVVVASKIFQVAGQVTPERESRCRCVC